MTETTAVSEKSVTGRSLGQLAWLRFRRNKAAMGGTLMLLLVAVFSFFGPFFSPHSYDQVFSSYVSVGPSLSPRPDPQTLEDVAAGVAKRRPP